MSNHFKSTTQNPGGCMVIVRNDNIEKAIKKLKNKAKKEGLFMEMDKRRCYDKPSIHRAKAKAVARKRHLKELRKRFEDHGY